MTNCLLTINSKPYNFSWKKYDLKQSQGQDQVTDLTEQLHKTQNSGTEALNKLKEQHSKEQTDMEKKHKQDLQSLLGQNDEKEKLLKDFDEQKININKERCSFQGLGTVVSKDLVEKTICYIKI